MIIRSFLLSAALLLATNNVGAADSVGANFTVTYTYVAPACAVSTSDSNVVPMGIWDLHRFSSVGTTTDPVTFHIMLTCNQDFANGVTIKFSGVSASQDSTVLALTTTSSEGVAQGVGIVIYDDENNVVPLNTDSKAYAVTKGTNNDLQFKASYKVLSFPVTAGLANATATFVIDYP